VNTTMCWKCNHVYPIDAPRCYKCNAANANVDPDKAQAEAWNERPDRPTRAAIIGCISAHFGVNESVALDWILAEFRGDIEFAARREVA